MKKLLIILCPLIILIFSFILYIIYAFTIEEKVLMSKKIEAYIPVFAKMEENDHHGGFNGDGELLAKVYFSEGQAQKFIESINENGHWRKLPMTEQIKNHTSDGIYEDIEIPIVENGYWFVLDRHSSAIDKYNELDIFNEGRYSLNFSVAVFDTDTNILYYYEEDT